MALYRPQAAGPSARLSCSRYPADGTGLAAGVVACRVPAPLPDGDYLVLSSLSRYTPGQSSPGVAGPSLRFSVRSCPPPQRLPRCWSGRSVQRRRRRWRSAARHRRGPASAWSRARRTGSSVEGAFAAAAGHWSGALDLRALPDGVVTLRADRPDLPGSTATVVVNKDVVAPVLQSLTTWPDPAGPLSWQAHVGEPQVRVRVAATGPLGRHVVQCPAGLGRHRHGPRTAWPGSSAVISPRARSPCGRCSRTVRATPRRRRPSRH